jgi:hypothetical protein
VSVRDGAPFEFDVEGPILGEVFAVRLEGDPPAIAITGPDGPRPWRIELPGTEHPVAAVDRIVRGAFADPRLVHSTSWRTDGSAVILSFIVVVDLEATADLPGRRIGRADLARSEARAAPGDIATDQVLEHALRHLAWLAKDDAVVRAELSEAWLAILSGYVPEPFRNLA